MVVMRGLGALLTAWAAAEAPEAEVARIQAEMCRTYFFVEMVLDSTAERPDAPALQFLYDTGASITIADPDAIQRVSGINVSENKNAVLSGAQLGSFPVDPVTARLVELDHLSISLGREIDGILGYDAFGDYLVTLDYQTGEIILAAGALPPVDNKTIFSTRGKDSRPWLRVRIDGRRKRLLVDSGSGGAIAVAHLDRLDTQEPPVVTGSSSRLHRIETKHGARLDGEMTFGEHAITAPLVSSAGQSELFGGELMSAYTITFDFDNRRQRWVQRDDGPVTSAPKRGLGVQMKPTDAGLEVVRPLADIGDKLVAGDVITHIGGLPVRSRGCGLSGDSVSIVRLRDGVSEELTIQPVTLIK